MKSMKDKGKRRQMNYKKMKQIGQSNTIQRTTSMKNIIIILLRLTIIFHTHTHLFIIIIYEHKNVILYYYYLNYFSETTNGRMF